ncbi:hypothetical protein IWW36_004661, partial [Coemansia brasiliensis]
SSNMKTPVMTRQSYGRSGAASHSGTPQVAASTQGKLDKTTYVEVSQEHNKYFQAIDFEGLLELLGADWKAGWDSVNSGYFMDDIGKILHSYAKKCDDGGLKTSGGKVGEKTYQTAFGVLAEAVQGHLSRSSEIKPGMYWHDTHSISLKRKDNTSRKPDGGFAVSKQCDPLWQDLAVVVEIKGDELKNDSHWIRGQILCDFKDMAELEPRRFMVGLAIAKHGSVRVYLYTPGRIYSAPLGSMPFSAGDKSSEGASEVIAFLLLLHKQLPVDSGFLAKKRGIFSACLEISELADGREQKRPCPSVRHYCSEVYGRHKQLNAQQTWVYPVQYRSAAKEGSAFFKFQWEFKNDDETAIHEFLLARKVPHVPKLLFSTHITAKGLASDDWICKGEAMLVEDVGESIITKFDGSELSLSDAEVVNVFAGYAHTLIAAAAVDADSKYVLHRDISTGNLMVKNDKSPYIIDWGYGHVCTEDEERLLSGKQMIGTTIYMGIRVLNGCLSRSLVDDLESLFLVLCHCLWLKYGRRNSQYEALWKNDKMSNIVVLRSSWLTKKSRLLFMMECAGNIPKALEVLALGMYELLFPSDADVFILGQDERDPRADAFEAKQWLGVFEEAAEHACGTSMQCIKELRKYVSEVSNLHISSARHKEGAQPSDVKDKGNEQSIPATPTKLGSKRYLDSLTGSTSKKPRL